MKAMIQQTAKWLIALDDPYLDVAFITRNYFFVDNNFTAAFVQLDTAHPGHVKAIGRYWNLPPTEESKNVRGFRSLQFSDTHFIVSSRSNGRSMICTPGRRHETLLKHGWTQDEVQDLIDYALTLGIRQPKLMRMLAPCIEKMEKIKGEL